jgi:hypothetical protein
MGADGDNHGFTPRKASRREFSTPSKGWKTTTNVHPADLDPYDSPSSLRRLFSPSTHRQSQQSPLPLKTSIAPTPHRDGQVLGLFDLLSASGGSTATPSAKRVATLGREAIQTPSKKVKMDAIDEGDDEEEGIGRLGRTPASSSKKLYLEKLFATPTTLRYATMIEDEDAGIHRYDFPQATDDDRGINALGSETPSFLRRSNSGRFRSNPNPTATDLSPVAVRKPQRFGAKGLSALLQGLRDMEQERLQDDWEILQELEQEQAMAAEANDDVQVDDSQVPLNGGAAVHGRLRKKKGQKRTTRLVKMRPVISKPKRTPQATSTTQEAEDESEDELAVSPPALAVEISHQEPPQDEDGNAEDASSNDEAFDHDDHNPNSDSDSAYDDNDNRKNNTRPTKRQSKMSSFSEKIKAAFSVVKMATKPGNNHKDKSKGGEDGGEEEEEEEGKKAKKPAAARKINPEAHANYRSLKIRSKGSKGRGRFGRRR